MAAIGIIGGSGLYHIEALKNRKEVKLKTPFGEPSDSFVTGTLAGRKVVFLARHGRGHTILPSELNYRANIWGMKKLGVERIISVGAVGSLKEHFRPLDIVIVDQFVDRTNQARRMTFFGDGVAGHIGFAHPVCEELSGVVYRSARDAGATVHKGGAYLNMEGPAFSTLAESKLYRSWGMDVIGMTNMGEARLAREAEICYSTMAMITDYDCWHVSEEEVTVNMIIGNLNKNTALAKRILLDVVKHIPAKRSCGCSNALKYAIITQPDKISASTRKKLNIILGKYLK